MNVAEAIERVLLGESLRVLSQAYRSGLLLSAGVDAKTARADLFVPQTRLFVNQVCRELGDRHGGDHRALVALRDWAHFVCDYEVFDALLTHFEFAGKEAFVRRGRALFPGPLTSHWDG